MITRSELLDLIYRYYPRGVRKYAREHVPPGEPFYGDTEERRRLVEASRRAIDTYPTWAGLIRPLEDRYALQNESLCILGGVTQPAYSARIWLDEQYTRSFGLHVCFLGPYYGIHRSGAPDEEPVVRDVVRAIEAAYPGYQTIPPELGNEVVPDVEMDGALLGEATIYVCLFSYDWRWSAA